MSRHAALLVLLATGCAAPPDANELFSNTHITVAEDAETASAVFTDLFAAAEDTLHVALPTAEDMALSDGILDAWGRGVDVRVVTDVDESADPAIVALVDAGVPVTLADAGIAYFDFSQNADVEWPSTDVIMSHAFAIADRTDYVTATTVGGTGSGSRVVLSGHSEQLGEDLETEFNQIFGGSDASALTVYSSMAKSIADYRWRYGTQTDVQLQMWLGPQERTTKRVIDEVYAARASVRVLTNDFANEGLVAALQEKAATGFDVQVIVGPGFGGSSSALSRLLESDAPDVARYQVSGVDVVPTLVLIDLEGGRDTSIRAMLVSHDLYSSSRFYRAGEVRTDQLIDGNLFVFEDWDGASEPIQQLEEVWQAHLDLAEAL